MIYSKRIEKAIITATKLHKNQTRKVDQNLPYISHPFSVFVILTDFTKDEDTLIAGLLHDTIEDTKYTFEKIEKEFGTKVAQIVRCVTEDRKSPPDKTNWLERKQQSIDHLNSCSVESLLVCAADKIHYMICTTFEIKRFKEKFFERVNGSPSLQLWYYKSILEALRSKLDNEIVNLYEKNFRLYEKQLRPYL